MEVWGEILVYRKGEAREGEGEEVKVEIHWLRYVCVCVSVLLNIYACFGDVCTV